jgi:dienelactone hydrolase
MTRLNATLILLLSLFFIHPSFSQKQSTILNWKADVSLNTYLVQQLHVQYDTRRMEFNRAITAKESTLSYIKTVKQQFKALLGTLPENAALKPVITGVIEKQDYRIEKIVYQSFENHHVTANLYVPKGNGKFPAVLLFCGHEDLAKATDSYQRTAILFAENGFVVLVVDPISQSERVQLTDDRGKALTRGSTTEHTLLNLSSSLVGTSVAAYELFDNVRSLDYLVTRPEVDVNKIGCLGNSGGAMQAIYFAAFDDRVKIVAPCSYLASRENTLATSGAADGCAQIPNEGLAQLEMSDYLIAAAPKPMLILAGRYDFIDYNGTLQSVDDLKKVYKTLNAPEKLKLFTFDDGHGISKPKREVAVQWFRRWFLNDPKPIREGDLETLTDKELFVTAKNNVNLSYPDEVTIAARNLHLFNVMASARQDFAKQSLVFRQGKVKELLGIKSFVNKFELETVAPNQVILRYQTEMPLPMRLYPAAGGAKKVVIWLGAEKEEIERYGKQSTDFVVVADVRGTGETMDKAALNDPKYFSQDYRNAVLALHMGKPLVGQRTTDIINLINFVKSDPKLAHLPIEINAIGLIGIDALHAAFLNPKISKVNITKCISSYQEILKQPLAKDRYGAVIPNVLSYYDLPDLVNWIGENKVVFQ